MKRRDFLAAGAAAVAAGPGLAAGGAKRLANTDWSVEIDPATLAITAIPADSPPILLSRGSSGHRIEALVRSENRLAWSWDGLFDLECRLDGPDLAIRIAARRPGELKLVDQPPSAWGRGLIFPFNEGYYIRPDDAAWLAHLGEPDRVFGTTEDLGLPLWGLDHGAHAFHWILANPFDSELRFSPEAGGLALALSHRFTRLSAGTPMELLLHLGPADLLGGAKRYRRLLAEMGQWRPLAEKIAASSPEAARLIGASHVYLWGNGLIGAGDIADWPAFLARLGTGEGLAARLRAREPDLGAGLSPGAAAPARHERQAIVDAVNGALNHLARARWQKEEVDPAVIVAAYAELRREFAAEFGTALTPDPAQWGSGLSAATFDALRKAGLDRLWIGLGDGWEGGLWRPEAVRAGARAGYLVAPYDSYETAIPPGERPDWATAQLGRAAWRDCAIIRHDGTPLPGFQKTGHYTDPICVAPILESRVAALAKAGGFNSWFLDVYGTGMVHDNHRPGRETSTAAAAAAQVAALQWVSESQSLPTGAEGGNAIGAAGLLFAHGIGTPLFGWGDPAMRDKDSPFHLGNWHPPENPAVFFRPVPVKQPYLGLYFDPATRLPLHQAAFHGSVITSHQWAYDQLKIANAVEDRALTQQLYNAAPLFHLSAASLPGRLEAMKRHDAFFRPLHQRIAHATLEAFEWLSEDRLVQRTRFSDGTQLIANFAPEPRQAAGFSLPPKSVTAIIAGRIDRVFHAVPPPHA